MPKMVLAVRTAKLAKSASVKSNQTGQVPADRIQTEKKAGAKSSPPSST